MVKEITPFSLDIGYLDLVTNIRYTSSQEHILSYSGLANGQSVKDKVGPLSLGKFPRICLCDRHYQFLYHLVQGTAGKPFDPLIFVDIEYLDLVTNIRYI